MLYLLTTTYSNTKYKIDEKLNMHTTDSTISRENAT